ncbi:MAG: HD domain-containing protein [Lachnospiraceae bacterium]|nr:HD domain-containing protein [Lachnospiraceae bacterium]
MEFSREIELIRRVSNDIPRESDMQGFLSHARVVSMLSGLVAEELGLSEEECDDIRIAGMLHDVGKLTLAEQLYAHDENMLGVEHTKYVRMHPAMGNELLRREQVYSEKIISYIACHHENYDGSGYPNHLEGEDIPFGARILRVCDVFSALVSNRTYRAAFSVDAAIEMMIEDVREYDMRVFLAFLSVVHKPEFEQVKVLIDMEQQLGLYNQEKLRRKANEQ